MKIRIKLSHGSWETSQTGKGKFILRLVPELEKLGCKITDSLDEEVDLDFQISRRHYQPVKCKKTALRIGPAYLTKEKRGKWLNHRKKEGVKHSDAVIYQSELGKKMCDKFIYKRNGLSRIIFNGSDRTEITPFSSPFEHNFLASTRVWKKQKRLSDIKKAFLISERRFCFFHTRVDAKKLCSKGLENGVISVRSEPLNIILDSPFLL